MIIKLGGVYGLYSPHCNVTLLIMEFKNQILHYYTNGEYNSGI